MKIYEMKLAGDIDKKTGLPIAFATIHRVPGGDTMTVTISQPSSTSGVREHVVEVHNPEDVFSMAECLQFHLDGCQGTNSMVHDYYRILEHFTD